MATTHVVLFTRDLRVHDHPALHGAVEAADHVVPLFVLDDAILGSPPAAPNRGQFLLDSLTELRGRLADLGGGLVLRRGDVATQVREVVEDTGAEVVHLSRDVSRYARRREQRLAEALAPVGTEVATHPGHLLVEPGEVTPMGGDHFKVFTPYWRRWKDPPHRAPLPPPVEVSLPTVARGAVPPLAHLVTGEPSPEVQRGGEGRARERVDAWLDGPIAAYEETRNDLADPDGTSRLSAHLHLGTLSVAEVVDAGMRQLRREGYMHNRARMLTASFLTKHLYVDWRRGADHFAHWLVDGDLANNWGQWQWIAGTGTDSRPNRMLNPVTQGRRHDREGTYVRRHVPELADVDTCWIHAPWQTPDGVDGLDYPPPIVDHDEARARFLAARGAD